MNFLLQLMPFHLLLLLLLLLFYLLRQCGLQKLTMATHPGCVFINILSNYIVIIFTKVMSIKLWILYTCIVLLLVTNLVCFVRCLVFFFLSCDRC
jgi:hypothetical protein